MDLSLRDLALRSGVSAPMLSQVERGETSPTLQVATRIAARPGAAPVAAAAPRRGRRGDGRARAASAGPGPARPRGHAYEILTPPLPGQRAELSRHTLAAGAVTGGPGDPPMHEPGSRETALVQEGTVVLHCDGARHELAAGDCVTFDADLPHHFENPGTDGGRAPGSGERGPQEELDEPPMPKSLFDKIWEAHEVAPGLLYIDLHLVHEVTSPQAFDGLRLAGRQVRRPDRTLATADHNVPTDGTPVAARIKDELSRVQVETLERNCEEFGIPVYSLGSDRQGIVHVIGPELGVTQPGMTIVCGDSHTATHGAFGALAFGIGTCEVEHVLATQCLVQSKPKSMIIRYEGELGFGVTAKDLILATIGQIGVDGAVGHVVEYSGTGDRVADHGGPHDRLQHDDRGRRPRRDDRPRRDHVRVGDRPARRAGRGAPTTGATCSTDEGAELRQGGGRSTPARSARWSPGAPTPRWSSASPRRCPTPRTTATSAPCTTWAWRRGRRSRRSSSTASSSARAPTRGSAICAPPPRWSAGARWPTGVYAMVVPGSQQVKAQAEQEGLDEVFRQAGFDWRGAGCSMCLGMNPDIAAPGERVASTSNRNFEGRQGRGARSHLVSPQMAAAAAIEGHFVDIREWDEPCSS